MFRQCAFLRIRRGAAEMLAVVVNLDPKRQRASRFGAPLGLHVECWRQAPPA